VRRVCVDVEAVLLAVEQTGVQSPPAARVNLEAQLSGLQVMEREMRSGPPTRRIWSLGQAAVPVVSLLLTALARRVMGQADSEISRCRSSVSELADALICFAVGDEVLPIDGAEIDLVIFDCDGVLVDSELISIALIAELLESEGISLSVEEVGDRFVGRSHDFIMRSLHADFGPPSDAVRNFETTVLAAFPGRLQPVEGMHEALARIDTATCVGSNGALDRVRLSLGLTGLDAWFAEEHLFSAEMVPRPKPSPDLFLHAAHRIGVDPSKVLVIEDSVAGVTAAVTAGMWALGFVGGSHARPPLAVRLLDAGAHMVVDSAQQVTELFHVH
jgi:beta-phosphoglucomutase-like phosphatase (HAD superfamily)